MNANVKVSTVEKTNKDKSLYKKKSQTEYFKEKFKSQKIKPKILDFNVEDEEDEYEN